MAIGVGGDSDYDMNIQDRWWWLMGYALKEKKLCISIERHYSNEGDYQREVLLVDVYPVDRNPEGKKHRSFDSVDSVEHYFRIERYVKEYNP